MPTYEYLCGACDERVEIFQSMSEGPKRKCPKCKRSKLVRQIGSGAGILFKGSGFYQTDYRSDSYKSAQKADKPSEPRTESKPAADAKPAPKPKPGAAD